MTYGMTEDGRFDKKDVADIRADLARHVESELDSTVSLRQNSPVQQLIDAFAVEISRQWDAAEASYYASFFEDATGDQLDKQLAIAGFSREPLRPAEGVVIFSRSTPAPRDLQIPAGTRVRVPETQTRPNIPFETRESARIFKDEQQSDEVPIEGLSPFQITQQPVGSKIGESSNVGANEITEIVDAISGVESVNNPVGTGTQGREEFQDGRDRENDANFKLRYITNRQQQGVSTLAAVEANVFEFDEDIVSVRAIEVYDEANNDYGVRVAVLATGVPDETIAQAVFESRAAGVDSFGNQSGVATFDDGRTQVENFDRADAAEIYIDVTLTLAETYPEDGGTRVEDNVIRFIGGEANSGILYPGLEIGDDVIFDQVKQRIMQVRGVRSADVTIGRSDNPTGKTNVSIGNLEAPRTDDQKISLSVDGGLP